MTTIQPLFKIPDLAVSNPRLLPHHQILPARAVGPFPRLSLSIVRADRSHHFFKCPLSEISSIFPGLRSPTCLLCLYVMAWPRWHTDSAWMLSDALQQSYCRLQLWGKVSPAIKEKELAARFQTIWIDLDLTLLNMCKKLWVSNSSCRWMKTEAVDFIFIGICKNKSNSNLILAWRPSL